MKKRWQRAATRWTDDHGPFPESLLHKTAEGLLFFDPKKHGQSRRARMEAELSAQNGGEEEEEAKRDVAGIAQTLTTGPRAEFASASDVRVPLPRGANAGRREASARGGVPIRPQCVGPGLVDDTDDTPSASHVKNHGVHFEHVHPCYCPPLADPALKLALSVRTRAYAQNVPRGS